MSLPLILPAASDPWSWPVHSRHVLRCSELLCHHSHGQLLSLTESDTQPLLIPSKTETDGLLLTCTLSLLLSLFLFLSAVLFTIGICQRLIIIGAYGTEIRSSLEISTWRHNQADQIHRTANSTCQCTDFRWKLNGLAWWTWHTLSSQFFIKMRKTLGDWNLVMLFWVNNNIQET